MAINAQALYPAFRALHIKHQPSFLDDFSIASLHITLKLVKLNPLLVCHHISFLFSHCFFYLEYGLFVNLRSRISSPLLFRERGRRERKKHHTSISCLLHALQPGPKMEPATNVCALDLESNQQSCNTRAEALTNESHWPGLEWF